MDQDLLGQKQNFIVDHGWCCWARSKSKLEFDASGVMTGQVIEGQGCSMDHADIGSILKKINFIKMPSLKFTDKSDFNTSCLP